MSKDRQAARSQFLAAVRAVAVGVLFLLVLLVLLLGAVVKLFQDSLAQRVRLGMVFVTEHGEPDEELLGILTAWDMAAFF